MEDSELTSDKVSVVAIQKVGRIKDRVDRKLVSSIPVMQKR